ncbi:hypothetical protein ACJQWK_07452 [Exserohilum turcicum]
MGLPDSPDAAIAERIATQREREREREEESAHPHPPMPIPKSHRHRHTDTQPAPLSLQTRLIRASARPHGVKLQRARHAMLRGDDANDAPFLNSRSTPRASQPPHLA